MALCSTAMQAQQVPQEEQVTHNFFNAILCADGTVQTVGQNMAGQLGLGNTIAQSTFSTVPGLSDVQQISVGGDHVLALKCDGTVWTWGDNYAGQLGIGSLGGFQTTAVPIPNLTDVVQVATGGLYSLALKADGTIWAWGNNDFGQLGNGNTTDSTTPVAVIGISTAIDIAAQSSSSLALLSDGTIKAWGYNYLGNLGVGNNILTNPLPLNTLNINNAINIEAGGGQGYAILSNGTVMKWGQQFGNTPSLISGLNNVVAMGAGDGFGVVLQANGELKIWGFCGTTANSPITGPTIPGVVDLQICSTGQNVIAILSDGTVRIWGANNYGQLGIGSTTPNSTCTPQTPLNLCAAHTPGNTDLSCCLNNTTFNQALNNGAVFYTDYIAAVPGFGAGDTRSGFVVGDFPTSATTIDWNAATNPFGTPDIYLEHDLVVPNNVTLSLNNLNIHFAPHARILVLRGGRLRLGNSTTNTVQLTGLCQAMWQGIQVIGPGVEGITSAPRDIALRNFGVVDADNVHIQQALMGIAAQYMYLMDINNINTTLLNTADLNTMDEYPFFAPLNWYYIGLPERKCSGGVVRANNGAHFSDCFEGINLSFYDNNAIAAGTSTNYKCSIQNSRFDSPLGLDYPFTLPPYTQLHSEAGVSLNVYANVEVGNNNSSLPPNSFTTQKYGIRGNLAYNLSIRRNNISTCDAGISIHNSNTPINGLPAFGTANIRHNTLNNNRIGLQAFGANMEVIGNLIDGNFTTTAQPRIGLFIGGSQFLVSNNNNLPNGNTIINQLIGAFITSNETSINHIRNNQFQNCFLPIWAFGANGFANDADPTGVNITCNEFDQYATAIQVQQAANPIYGTDNRLNDQGSCDANPATIDHPADNTFFQTAVFDGLLPDVRSLLPSAATFTYFHRGGTIYTPQGSGAVNVVLCSPPISENSCTYPLFTDAAIQQIIATDPKNRAAIDKMYFYLHDENDSLRNIAAAVQVLESINTDAAKRLLLGYDLQQGDYNALAQHLNQLPEATLNQQYFKQLTTLNSQLRQSNRSIFQLNNTEKNLLHTIAHSNTQTAFDAQAILFVTQGEEYPLTLPELPDFFSPDMIQSFANFTVTFKTDQNNSYQFSKLYPNPNNGIAYIDYTLTDNQQATLHIYNINGQGVNTYTITGNGTLSIDTNNLQNGIYYYTLQQANGSILQRDKIVVIR